MTKRLTDIDFVECYQAIFNDWLAVHPEDLSETTRDYNRIALEFSSRGLPFFTIDLPAIGKLLDRALDDGLLVPSGAPHTRAARKGSSIPRLFRGFWIRIFDEKGHLREDADVDAIAFLRTLLYLGKKLRVACATNYVTNTVKEYYRVEENLPPPTEWWENQIYDNPGRASFGSLADRVLSGFFDSLVPHHGDPVEGSLPREYRGGGSDSSFLAGVQRIADRLSAQLGFIEDDELKPKHGPGAVSEEIRSGSKFNFPTWSPQLEEVLPFSEFGTHSWDSFLEGSSPSFYPKVEETASKLIAVPKTQKGPRLIASEPIANQWMQQAVAFALRKRVASSDLGRTIDFFDQRPSQEAALQASKDGKHGTIDLSSASDRLSCWLVQRVFRANIRLLTLCACTRTRYLRNPKFTKFPELIRLRKFASMGSALTFPVQSIVFSILAISYGVNRTGCTIREAADEVRVFGDDIIIPKDWVAGFSSMLEDLYLKVNHGKTFSAGNFRESCGMDGFRGYDVTPGYLRQPSGALYTREALGYMAVVNNLFEKGYWHLSKYLESTVRWSRKLAVVNRRSRAFGLVTFSNGISPDLLSKVRWDHDLQEETIIVDRLVSRPAVAGLVESWNILSAWFFRNKEEPTLSWDGYYRPDWRETIGPEEQHLSLQEVVDSSSRMPALIRRTKVPLHRLQG